MARQYHKRKYIPNMSKYIHHCEICNIELSDTRNALSLHIRSHDISKDIYYKLYIDSRTTCKGCDKELQFRNLQIGYTDYCHACNATNQWSGPKGEARKDLFRKKMEERGGGSSLGGAGKRNTQPRLWRPKNMSKYLGNPYNITARSSWEIRFFNWCDNNPQVIGWSSEEIIIPYICPTDNRPHRYYPDALLKIRNNKGELKTYLVEIKPRVQTKPPVFPGKNTKRYITEVMTWGKNEAKWKYATEYALDRGWEFIVLDEYALGISK